MIQELIHWLKYVGILVIIADFEVNYGTSMDLPQDPNKYVTSCLQPVTTLDYLHLRYYVTIVDEGFAAYADRREWFSS